ncbi:MAG: stage II sporulation protein M [Limnochordia bacterium]|jgi:stage II sporulation protein M|nr:stage II sporulation protein M [Limnochordia bacterium]
MFIAGAFGELIGKYFLRHLPLYLALILLFAFGLGFGAVATQKLSPVQKDDLASYIAGVYTSLGEDYGQVLPRGDVFSRTLMDNVVKTAGLIFLLGLTVIGAPLILAIVFVRGFVLGFTVGFLVQETMVQGLVLSTTCILPHNLLVVPAVLIVAGGALSFSATALKTLLGLSKEGIYGQFASTTFLALCSGGLFVLAALIEAYLTPILARFGSGFLT